MLLFIILKHLQRKTIFHSLKYLVIIYFSNGRTELYTKSILSWSYDIFFLKVFKMDPPTDRDSFHLKDLNFLGIYYMNFLTNIIIFTKTNI